MLVVGLLYVLSLPLWSCPAEAPEPPNSTSNSTLTIEESGDCDENSATVESRHIVLFSVMLTLLAAAATWSMIFRHAPARSK